MDDDDPLAFSHRKAATETLDAASARLKPAQRVDGALYRVVEVLRAPDGRITRVGQIWHSDLARVRRFGHALAGNTSADQVQVADAGGQVIETIPAPPPGTPPTGWRNWRATAVPAAPPLPGRPRPAPRPAVKPPPTMVPPIIPQALPATPKPPRDLPVMPPESAVERTNPLPPTHA
jgi:hypothetical protein